MNKWSGRALLDSLVSSVGTDTASPTRPRFPSFLPFSPPAVPRFPRLPLLRLNPFSTFFPILPLLRWNSPAFSPPPTSPFLLQPYLSPGRTRFFPRCTSLDRLFSSSRSVAPPWHVIYTYITLWPCSPSFSYRFFARSSAFFLALSSFRLVLFCSFPIFYSRTVLLSSRSSALSLFSVSFFIADSFATSPSRSTLQPFHLSLLRVFWNVSSSSRLHPFRYIRLVRFYRFSIFHRCAFTALPSPFRYPCPFPFCTISITCFALSRDSSSLVFFFFLFSFLFRVDTFRSSWQVVRRAVTSPLPCRRLSLQRTTSPSLSILLASLLLAPSAARSVHSSSRPGPVFTARSPATSFRIWLALENGSLFFVTGASLFFFSSPLHAYDFPSSHGFSTLAFQRSTVAISLPTLVRRDWRDSWFDVDNRGRY